LDGTVSATIKGKETGPNYTMDEAGLIARFNPKTNTGYVAVFFPKDGDGKGFAYLYKVENGDWTSFGWGDTYFTYEPNTWASASLDVKDVEGKAKLTVIINGQVVIQYEDATPLGAGQPGLYCQAEVEFCKFNDFSFAGDSATAENDTNCVACSSDTFSALDNKDRCGLKTICPEGQEANADNTACVDRRCTCSNGTSVADGHDSCQTDGDNVCAWCDYGYRLSYKKCVTLNECSKYSSFVEGRDVTGGTELVKKEAITSAFACYQECFAYNGDNDGDSEKCSSWAWNTTYMRNCRLFRGSTTLITHNNKIAGVISASRDGGCDSGTTCVNTSESYECSVRVNE